MSSEELKAQFNDVIKKWRAAESQRMIFGVDMPQTQRAVKDLAQSIKAVHGTHPSFALVEKEGKMEIVIKSGSSVSNIPVSLPSLPKIFKEIKLSSITLDAGVSATDLSAFFRGIGMKAEDLERKGGLKKVLQGQNVTGIKVDQMKFQLLNDEEQVITDKEDLNEILKGVKWAKGAKPTGEKEKARTTKEQNALWKDFIDGKLEPQAFKSQNRDMIDAASQDPKKLEKVVKRLVSKQKEAEKFLADLENRFSDIGLSKDAIENLKKKVRKPKKVMVAEDELARLRKIEKEYEKGGADKQTVNWKKSVNVIQNKLSQEMARSEALLHQIGQGGVVLDKDGKILSVNKTALNILNCTEEAVRGKKLKEILQPHHLLTSVTDWQKETEAHTPNEVTAEITNEESLAVIRESTIVLENENGRSIGLVSAVQNVTQQEELNRRKNDILDVLGHDLRAPVGAIKQNFDVLVASAKLNETADEQQKKFLENCKNNITRISKLIEKIMDMRQLETGKITLKYDTVETNKLLEEAVHSLNTWAQNKKIALNTESEQLPDIEGDPERLYQVITNLVSNALKFTPEGGTITVTGKTGGDSVEIAVKDSGMGIDQDNLEKIFDKYAQVTANSPAGVSGLGLGLSICKTVIEMHGGTIKADSTPGKGSTFSFKIPVKQSTE